MKITNAHQLSVYMKDTRFNQKLSQGNVASKVGIRQDTVSRFELHPETTKLDTFFKILSALNLELTVQPRNTTDTDPSSNASTNWKEEW